MFFPTARVANLAVLKKVCLARNIEIKDDATIKLGSEVVNIPEVIPHATRGQLDFVSSFIYYLTVIEAAQNSSLRELVLRLYQKLNRTGLEMIHQTGFRGSSGVIEYVRPEDMQAILYRLKCVDFIRR